jgi:hypothetical protein
MYPHRIRLRGPWEAEPLASGPPPLRMTLPARWGEAGLPGFAGAVRFRRKFGLPRRIDDLERVWLTCAGVEGRSDWSLNGELLGSLALSAVTAEFEVTRRLRGRNELVVEVEAATDAGGLWGEVALEVRCSAYLRGVRAEAERSGAGVRLRVRGEVSGEAGGPLELYVLAGGGTVGYGPCRAGGAFEVVTEELKAGELPPAVRVDLVCGAVIWYALEIEVSHASTKCR